ncbi:MAG: 2-dehydro-3-deoxyglucarate aldolase, partial [uncultured Microvirga sp.]
AAGCGRVRHHCPDDQLGRRRSPLRRLYEVSPRWGAQLGTGRGLDADRARARRLPRAGERFHHDLRHDRDPRGARRHRRHPGRARHRRDFPRALGSVDHPVPGRDPERRGCRGRKGARACAGPGQGGRQIGGGLRRDRRAGRRIRQARLRADRAGQRHHLPQDGRAGGARSGPGL